MRSLWQHPYADIFKHTKISQWTNTAKSGDVTQNIDRQIGRKVFKIQGSVLASNNIQIPKPRSSIKTLSLTGRFIFFQLKVPPGKLFSIHLQLTVLNQKVQREQHIKITLSNLYKENRMKGGVQISVRPGIKWTVLCVDSISIVREIFGHQYSYKELKSLVLCANLYIRGVYTSDIRYSPKTLPKDLTFKGGSVQQWFELYDWVMVPESLNQEFFEETKGEQQKIQVKKQPVKPVPRSVRVKQPKRQVEKQEDIKEIEQLVESSEPVEIFQVYPESELLLPDPILQLESCITFTPKKHNFTWISVQAFPNSPVLLKENTKKFLIYSSHANIIIQNPTNKQQYILRGHTNTIQIIQYIHQLKLLASFQSDLLLFWDLKSKRQPVPFTIKKFQKPKKALFSRQKMLVSGLDQYNRDLLIIYDLSSLQKKKQVTQLALQLSEVQINDIIWIDQNRIVSCGKQNIKFYRVKSGHLPGSTVNLGVHSQVSFLSIALLNKKILVSSTQGSVLQINSLNRELQACFTVHTAPINSIKPLGEYLVSASSDSKVCIWSKDFSRSYIQASHASEVLNIEIIENSIACITYSSIGILDIQNNQYQTISSSYGNLTYFRSFKGKIGCINQINTIHILENKKTSVSLQCPTDIPKCLAFHPFKKEVACGFVSGALRILNTEAGQIQKEQIYHLAGVENLEFEKEGKFLVSQGIDGTVQVYDSQIQPLKTIEIQHPGPQVSVHLNQAFVALTGNYGNEVKVFQTKGLMQKYNINIVAGSVLKIQFAENGNLCVLIGSQKNSVQFYSVQQDKASLIRQVELDVNISSFTVSPNCRFIASCIQNVIRIQDFNLQKPAQNFIGHLSSISHLEWDLGQNLYSFSGEQTFLHWKFLGDTSEIPIEQTKAPSPQKYQNAQNFPEISTFSLTLQEQIENYLNEAQIIQAQTKKYNKAQLKHIFGYSQGRNLHLSLDQGWYLHSSGPSLIQTLLQGQTAQKFCKQHLSPISIISVSPDNQQLATAEFYSEIQAYPHLLIWDSQKLTPIKRLNYQHPSITDIAYSSCGEYLAVIGSNQLQVWQIQTTKLVQNSILAGCPKQIKWVPSIHSLQFVTLSSIEVVFWRLNDQKQLQYQQVELPENTEEMLNFDFSCFLQKISSYLLLIGTIQGNILICNVRTCSFVIKKRVLDISVTFIQAKQDRIILAGESASIFSYKGIFEEGPNELLLDGKFCYGSFSRTGEEGIVSSSNGSIWYVNWDQEATIRVDSSHSKQILAVAANQRIGVSTSRDLSIKVWDLELNEQILQFKTPNFACVAIALHPNLPLVIGGFEDGTLKFFDLKKTRVLGASQVFSRPISALKLSFTGDCIIVGGQSGQILPVYIHQFDPLKVEIGKLDSLKAKVSSVDISKQSRYILATSNQARLCVWQKKLTASNMNEAANINTQYGIFDVFDVLNPEKVNYSIKDESLDCEAGFNDDGQIVVIIVKGIQSLLFRNFISHSIVKKVNLNGFPTSLSCFQDRLGVGLADRKIWVYDKGGIQELEGHSREIKAVCVTSRGIFSGSSNEIAVWEF